jgi:hypothetical protein
MFPLFVEKCAMSSVATLFKADCTNNCTSWSARLPRQIIVQVGVQNCHDKFLHADTLLWTFAASLSGGGAVG